MAKAKRTLVPVLRKNIISDLRGWPDTAETYKALTKIRNLMGKSEAGIYAPPPKKSEIKRARKAVAAAKKKKTKTKVKTKTKAKKKKKS